jgi:hypothetical protein
MKLTIIVFMITSMVFAPSTGRLNSQNAETSIYEDRITGTITNLTTGDSYQIPVVASTHQIGVNKFQTEYIAEIPHSVLTSSSEKSDEDPTLSARVYILQNYDHAVYGGLDYVRVNYYKGKWERLDSQVSCTRLDIKASVFGEVYGGGQINKSETNTVNNPANNMYYTETPSWAGQYVSINDTYLQRGTSTVYLLRGVTSWSFSVNVCQGGSFGVC